MCCGKKLADGQYWSFCGETDMGQTAPVRCINCGGSFKLAEPDDKPHNHSKDELKDIFEELNDL